VLEFCALFGFDLLAYGPTLAARFDARACTTLLSAGEVGIESNTKISASMAIFNLVK
jgi:hypothetical protein